MKNNFIIKIFLFLFLTSNLYATNLEITSSEVKLNKKESKIIFKGNIKAKDESNNILKAEEAYYSKEDDLLNSIGLTSVVTSENYFFESQNVIFDNKNKIIKSNFPTKIIDPDGNIILVNMFNYNSIKNILFSKGDIKLEDKKKNIYKFKQLYIDEKKKKIVGSDAKIFLNDNSLKDDVRNNPRIFANSVSIDKDVSSVQKGVFTFCEYRENEKCPPWELRAKQIKHNNSKKTVYYENAILKIYDFPIFYFPRLSHPDPTVNRRSGFLVPTFSNSTNMGSGIDIPYFWNIANDKDITFTPRFHSSNEPLYLTEYRQDFAKSFLIVDGGYTEGYKNKSNKKTPGARTHLFTKFYKSFIEETDNISNLEVNLQHVSNSTYPKINKLQTSLVDYLDDTIKNSVDYGYQKKDLFFNTKISAFESLSKTGNERFEFIYPEASLEKNLLMSENLGIVDLKSEILVKNFDVDKQTDVISNEFNWVSNSWINKFGFENEFLGLFKNVNYQAKNVNNYKTEDSVSEFYGALGFKSELGLFKFREDNKLNVFKPKMLLKISPNDSRNISKESKTLNYSDLYKLNKIKSIDKVDTGSSISLGFDFKINNLTKNNEIKNEQFKFSLGQIINVKENRDMPSKSTLNEKMSDIIGETSFSFNENAKITNNFLLDQNLREFNKNQIDLDIVYPKTSFNIGFLEESQHIGSTKYLQTKAGFNFNNGLISFGAKRNLLSNSAEFYDLSYEYINDCLKAGVAFRREFYRDRDLEPEDSLIFKITFSPLGTVTAPAQ
ncbi:MAG: hypothetical protein CMI78_00710 [Candidatus Pelagibacter sp.]|nr:hypothetical protein [Candidatus Pelagibacter sp.]OUW68447.1 MAG: hypothetical protein CBD62_01825 [Candidatus Pelagibacter sp. TMED202]|tara:strand:- start:3250 stop:5583 length:2334 start_codon:yes stop_codon:yes gene_type:complete